MPSEFEEMVHSIALEACKASPLPLDCEAVQTLEQALLPAMETFVTAAHAHAMSMLVRASSCANVRACACLCGVCVV